MSKKQKTIDLGRVMKPKGNPFFSFDSSIDKIVIHRSYEVEGEKVTEVLEVATNEVNGKTYLGSAFINKFQDNLDFKLSKGWIDEASHQKQSEYAQDKGISSLFQVKVESKS